MTHTRQRLRSLCHRRYLSFAFVLCVFFLSGKDLADEPHPWISSAPGEFQRLMDLGNVQFDVDDQKLRERRKTALTIFRFQAKFDFRYQYRMLPFDAESETWEARVFATLIDPKLEVKHTILFHSSFQPIDPWNSDLLKHEFDHVSISTDPRLMKIMKRLLERRRSWNATWQQEKRPSDDAVKDWIQAELESEIRQCEDMIQAQYDWLDRRSADGLKRIEDRTMFFQELFTDEGLERCRFPFSSSVKDLLGKQKEAAQAELVKKHYLP